MENYAEKKLSIDLQDPLPHKSSKRKWRPTVNRETLPLKVTLFFYYGAMSAILPYLTIHMQEIGISITEIAMIYVVLPFTSFLGPPITGFMADKFGQYKWVLVISTLGTAFFHTTLMFVPTYKIIPITAPVQLEWRPELNQFHLQPEANLHCAQFMQSMEKLVSNESRMILTSLENCKSVQSSFGGIEIPPLDFIFSNGSFSEEIKANDLTDGLEILVKLDTLTNCTYIVPPNLQFNILIEQLQIPICKTNLEFTTGETKEKGNNATTFWLYFLLRIIATIFATSCFALLDASTLAVVKKCGKAEYGRERIWSIVGMGCVSPIAGVLVDQISKMKGYTDYSPAFFLADAMLIFTAIAVLSLEINVDKSEKGVFKNAMKLFMYPEVVVFLIMVFVLGNLWGFVENYLFVFLKEINAPNYLLGLTLTVGSVVGIPFLWTAEKFVAKVGRVNLIIGAFVFYFIRFYGYSYLQNPFWCFPFEAMEAFTVHLMWTSAATYCALLAPKGLLASLTGVMGALHYSLGKGSGSFLGGLLYGKFGARLAFRYFGIGGGVFGIIFIILHYTWIRKIVEKRAAEAVERRKSTISKELQPLSGGIQNARLRKESISNYSDVIGNYEKGDQEDLEDLELKHKMLDHCEP